MHKVQRSVYSLKVLLYKYLTDLLAICCTFVKCGAVNLCICIYIYVVIVIVVLGFGYTRSALNIYTTANKYK